MRTLAANTLHSLARLCFAGERATRRAAWWFLDISKRLHQWADEADEAE